MDIKLMLVCITMIISQTSNGQIIGDFELWDTTYIHGYNAQLIANGVQNPMAGTPSQWKSLYGIGITRTTASHSEDFAIILHNWYHYSDEEITYKDGIMEFPKSISGYYKYIRENEHADTLLGSGELMIYNQEMQKIGLANFEFDTCTNYQYFEFPIIQLSNEQPDSIEIIIKNTNMFSSCSSFNPVCNFLYLDDITLNFPTSTTEINDEQYEIYPNPATNKIILKNHNNPNSQISIFDIHGRHIRSVVSDGQVEIDDLIPGLYILQIFNQNKRNTLRLVKL